MTTTWSETHDTGLPVVVMWRVIFTSAPTFVGYTVEPDIYEPPPYAEVITGGLTRELADQMCELLNEVER